MKYRLFKALLMKEFLSLLRDYQSLLGLFILPSLFILIMTFALQDKMDDSGGNSGLNILLIDRDQSDVSTQIIEDFQQNDSLRLTVEQDEHRDSIEEAIQEETYLIAIIIPKNLSSRVDSQFRERNPAALDLEMIVSPRADKKTIELIHSLLRKSMNMIMLSGFVDRINEIINIRHLDIKERFEQSGTRITYLYRGGEGKDDTGEKRKIPSSVQQSVPAWLVFGLFFVIFPISTTFINERNQGTLSRLRSMGVTGADLVIARILPYYIINMIQVGFMLLVGIALVPALGGEGLKITHAFVEIFFLSSIISLAAISFSFFIASISNTAEQAAIAGGVSNILLGAIGGIMVPSFIMPEWLQEISQLSPMAWGLNGFLDIILYGGGFDFILTEVLYLTGFSVVMVVMTVFLMDRNRGR